MQQRSDREVLERYERLPEELQRAIYGVKTKTVVREIAASQQLHIDQIGLLDYLVSEVMLGFMPPEEFATELEKELGVKREQAFAITQVVNEKIFLPIRQYLRQATEAVPQPQQPAPVPKREELPDIAIDRASMLKEIEAPEPVQPAFVVFPKPKEAPPPPPAGAPAPQTPATPSMPATSQTRPPAPSGDIAAEKLGGATSSTIESVNVGRDRSSYKIDPYREQPE